MAIANKWSGSSVDCWELADAYGETVSTTSYTPSVTLSCAWADRYDLINDIVGGNRVWAYSDETNLFAPRAYQANIKGHGIDGDGVSGAPQLKLYEKAHIKFDYKPLQLVDNSADPGNPKPYTAFSETITPYIDWIRLNHNDFYWPSNTHRGGRPVERDETPGFPVERLIFERTYYNWVGAVPATYLSLQGSCNSNTVTSTLLQRTFAAETLAYGAGPTNQSIQSDGTQSATVSVKFRFKSEGWNKYFDPLAGDFVKMKVRTAFPESNFPDFNGYRLEDYSGVLL